MKNLKPKFDHLRAKNMKLQVHGDKCMMQCDELEIDGKEEKSEWDKKNERLAENNLCQVGGDSKQETAEKNQLEGVLKILLIFFLLLRIFGLELSVVPVIQASETKPISSETKTISNEEINRLGEVCEALVGLID